MVEEVGPKKEEEEGAIEEDGIPRVEFIWGEG